MHFDDRLATVLRQRPESGAIARIQYRQLLDLLGAVPHEIETPRISAAYERLADLGRLVPASDRARILSEPGVRLRDPRLVILLCSGEPVVACAAIGNAHLTDEQWLDLVPALPLHARGVLHDRRDLPPAMSALMARLGVRGRGLPPADASATEPVEDDRPAAGREAPSPIGEIVRRIEALRQSRHIGGTGRELDDSPRLPLGDAAREHETFSRTFDFVTGTDGQIVWASGDYAAMAAGMRIGIADEVSALRMPTSAALDIRRRLPLRNVPVTIEGAPGIAGAWRMFATPRFDPLCGAYLGHAGRMFRPPEHAAPAPGAASPGDRAEGDRIRQLLHELRTPVNAIQGFAEVIQQQLFGPVAHEYRAQAAIIAADAARILGGFEELERLARLDSGTSVLDAGECEVDEVLEAISARLAAFTDPRSSGIDLAFAVRPVPISLGRPDAERLFWRLLATLVAACAPAERLEVNGEIQQDGVVVRVGLPHALALLDDEDLFRASMGQGQLSPGAGMFGTGFSLRLCRAEVRAAGGSLERRDATIDIKLPGLTSARSPHSQGETG